MIEFFNLEVDRYTNYCFGRSDDEKPEVEDFVVSDPTRISWSRALRAFVKKGIKIKYNSTSIVTSFYRPFTKQFLYFDRSLINDIALMPRFFPSPVNDNKIIMIKQRCGENSQLSIMIDRVVELQSDGGTQCFPLYVYEKDSSEEVTSLFARSDAKETDNYTRRDGISAAGLAHFQKAYPAKGAGATITKEDLFYYIYGLLHSADYRSRYADNLGKELPRIPAVKTFADFMAFSKAGRELAHWHLDYETVACYPGATLDTGKVNLSALPDEAFRVTKMKFAKTKDASGKSVNDKTTVIYNERIIIKNIPLAAYEYVVNGKPALEWVMERQAVTTDKDSGIVNDANLWATETMGNARYPLELFLRVITVSLETMKIVKALPPLGDPADLR